MAKITVKNTDVNVIKVNGEDYICLTDMLQAKDGDFFITDWLRNRNTLEFIGIWEKVYNPNFNPNRSLDAPSPFLIGKTRLSGILPASVRIMLLATPRRSPLRLRLGEKHAA